MGDRGREAGGLVPAVRRSRELGSKCGEGERGQGKGDHVGGGEGADSSEGDKLVLAPSTCSISGRLLPFHITQGNYKQEPGLPSTIRQYAQAQ